MIIWFLLAGLLLGGSAWWLYGIPEKKPAVVLKPHEQKTNASPAIQKDHTIKQATDLVVNDAPVIKITNKTYHSNKQAGKPLRRIERTYTEVRDQENKTTAVTNTDNDTDTDRSLHYANVANEPVRLPAAVDINITAPVVTATNTNQPNKPINKQANKPKWQFGVQASAGISDLGMELFQGTRVADFAYSSGVVSNPLPGNVPRASTVTSGHAFQVGGYVAKSISRKLRAKAGLSYEYYSNHITTGDHVASQRVINQGFGNLSMVDEYYKALGNNKYTNSYHFASLPASIQWQIGNHSKRNLVWENGITLSRMLRTNALVYDGAGGAYYKDNSVFKKTQWTLSTSLLFSIKTKNSMELFAGPHLQYGLSDLMKNNDKHLRYAGLKLAMGFNKK